MMETLRERIKRHEGLVLKPKYDAKGKYEIGYGHDIDAATAAAMADGCTQEQADAWLDQDIGAATDGVIGAMPWIQDIDEVRFGIVVEMAYELGVHGLLGFHHLLKAIQARDWAAAEAEMLTSAWHTQAQARCEELADLMLTGGFSPEGDPL